MTVLSSMLVLWDAGFKPILKSTMH